MKDEAVRPVAALILDGAGAPAPVRNDAATIAAISKEKP
ncbi:hypothetical protein ABIA70_001362 [Arthrobacter sp. 754]